MPRLLPPQPLFLVTLCLSILKTLKVLADCCLLYQAPPHVPNIPSSIHNSVRHIFAIVIRVLLCVSAPQGQVLGLTWCHTEGSLILWGKKSLIHPSIHPPIQCLLSTYYVPGTVLATRNTAVKKKTRSSFSKSLSSSDGDKQ